MVEIIAQSHKNLEYVVAENKFADWAEGVNSETLK